jgi:hypothetical protein
VKRSLIVLLASVALVVLAAGTAFADYPPKGVHTKPEVAPLLLKAPSGLAFTGSESVLPLLAVAVALALGGFGMMVLARRLKASSTD